MQRLLLLAIIAVTIAAALLRLAGIYDNFWLDEIWSWHIASTIGRPDQIFWGDWALSDNNHPLNTFFMWLAGHGPYYGVYRLPSLALGVTSVVWITLALRRRGAAEALIGATIFGLSYPLIVFSSEARGYAPAVFFAIVAFDAIDRFRANTRLGWWWNLTFNLACIFGFLAHLTFIHFWLASVVWSIWRWSKIYAPRKVIELALRMHVIPAAAITALYFGFVRRITIGGAPPVESRLDAFVDAFGSLLGAGDSKFASIALITIAAVLFITAIVQLHRRRDDLWVLMLAAVVISPASIIAVQILLVEDRQPIAARYFIIPYAFFLLAIVLLVTRWLQGKRVLRVAAGIVLIAYVGVNLFHTMMFLRLGRGQYHDAVTYMADHSPPVFTVLSDNQLRTQWVLQFYAMFLAPYQRMVIYDGTAFPPPPQTYGPPMWVIIHSNKRNQPPADIAGYLFDQEFSYYGLSGYSWYLYRHKALKL